MNNTANVISVDPRSELIQELERKGAFYTVKLLENYWFQNMDSESDENLVGQYQSTGKCTVVNMDTNKVIGVVSKKYVPVLNEDIFTQFDSVLINCPRVDLTGASVNVQTNGDGARIMVEYVLPAHQVTLANGDKVALSITALNSFDGSTGFKVFCGGLRFKCMNGMILGDTVASYQKKHCAGLSIEAAGKVIETGLNAYLNGVDSWNAQITAAITPQTAWKCLAEFAGMKDYADYETYKDYNLKRDKNNADGTARKLVIDSYYAILKQYIRELGATEWALNNALTHIATHGKMLPVDPNNKPSIQSQISKTEAARKLINKYLNKGVDSQ